MKVPLFVLSLLLHYAYILCIGWSIAFPSKRIWPPSRKWSWQYIVIWGLFIFAILANVGLVVVDWNSWGMTGNARFFLGVPLVGVGAILLGWSMWTLGFENTTGVQDGFVIQGPYKFTRNPQYIGDIVMFVGIIVIANSLYAWITFSLMILAFLMLPLAEETWLEEVYGEAYRVYKQRVPRFL